MTQSDGNSPPQPEEFTFFIERPLGKSIGLALRDAGLKVVLHLERLPDDSSDEAYLNLCIENDWIVLTGDSDVHSKENQKVAIRNGKLRVFRLTRNHWPWPEKLKAFTSAIPAIMSLLRSGARPFIARIDRNGKISTIEDLSNPMKEGDLEER